MNQEPQRKDESDDTEDERKPLPRVALRTFESLIDQHVRQAEESGQFKDLPGAGQPLKLDDDDGVPEDLRLGHRILKNAGYAPSWIELQKNIRNDQAQLAEWLVRSNQRWAKLGHAYRAQLRLEYEQRLRDLNKAIGEYNLIAPPAVGQLPLLLLEAELRKLG